MLNAQLLGRNAPQLPLAKFHRVNQFVLQQAEISDTICFELAYWSRNGRGSGLVITEHF